MSDHQPNEALARLRVAPIAMHDAERIVVASHYMRTAPRGSTVALGVFDGGRVVGVAVFGYSSSTAASVAAVTGSTMPREHYLEMQRLWVSDDYGHSTESFVLSRAMKLLGGHGTRLVVTHAGGCKNDVGIVYQASAWLYFGSRPCRDFFLTASGVYRNVAASLRFGRIKTVGKTQQQIGEALFGPGAIVEARRYLYAYPIDRGLRRRLEPRANQPPKAPAPYRRGQRWV